MSVRRGRRGVVHSVLTHQHQDTETQGHTDTQKPAHVPNYPGSPALTRTDKCQAAPGTHGPNRPSATASMLPPASEKWWGLGGRKGAGGIGRGGKTARSAGAGAEEGAAAGGAARGTAGRGAGRCQRAAMEPASPRRQAVVTAMRASGAKRGVAHVATSRRVTGMAEPTRRLRAARSVRASSPSAPKVLTTKGTSLERAGMAPYSRTHRRATAR